MQKFIENVKNKYGNLLSKEDYEEVYSQFYDLCQEEWGKPKMGFTSVVSFGKKVRNRLNELLESENIQIKPKNT